MVDGVTPTTMDSFFWKVLFYTSREKNKNKNINASPLRALLFFFPFLVRMQYIIQYRPGSHDSYFFEILCQIFFKKGERCSAEMQS